MKYIPIKDPDAERLRELIGKVKGNRSMSKFADDIKLESPNVKVSAPTLSRAMNWTEGTGAVSIDLLIAIAKVAGNTGVTLEALIEANGMRSQEDDTDLTKMKAFTKRRRAFYDEEQNVKMILQNEIADRGFSFQQLRNYSNWRILQGYVMQSDRMFPRNYTFGFSVSGMSPYSTWKFALDNMKIPDGAEAVLEGHVGNFINKVGAIFASDGFESDLYDSEKYSFVFIDKELYRLFLKRIKDHDIEVNGLMTAILIDLDSREVLEETQLKRYDGEKAPEFFKLSKIKNESNENLDDPLDMIDE